MPLSDSPSLKQNAPADQSGIALLTVLALVASMSLAATFALRATADYLSFSRSVEAQSSQYWADKSARSAGFALFASIMQTSKGKLNDVYIAQQRPVTFPTPNGTATIMGFEASNCLNINALGTREIESLESQNQPSQNQPPPPQLEDVYVRLLTSLGIAAPEAAGLHDRLADWIDVDTTSRALGAEDETYAIREAGHYAANAPLNSIDDLRVIDGYTPNLVKALRPLICTYRPDGPNVLNINTLRPEHAPLLMAFYSPDLTLESATQILLQRPTGGWADLSEFKAVEAITFLKEEDRNDAYLSTESRYIGFNVQINDRQGTATYRYIYTMGQKQRPLLISRDRVR